MGIDVQRVGDAVSLSCPEIEVQVVLNDAMSRVDCWGKEHGRKTYFGGVQRDGWMRAARVDSPERIAVVRALLDAVTQEPTP